MPIALPEETETTENPFSSAALSKNADVVVQDASQYEGKFGAARGPGSVNVVVLPGRGLISDMVTIVDEKGVKRVSMCRIYEVAGNNCAASVDACAAWYSAIAGGNSVQRATLISCNHRGWQTQAGHQLRAQAQHRH